MLFLWNVDMKFQYYQPNPSGRNVGDCTVRALSKALNQTWEKTFVGLCLEGFMLGDMPSANSVWGSYLRRNGYQRNLAPDDITVSEFSDSNSNGVYILALSGHVVCVVDNVLYDSWNSGNEIVLYFWQKE